MTTGRINQVATDTPGGAHMGAGTGGGHARTGRGCPKIALGRGDEAPGRLDRRGAPRGIPAILLPPLRSPGMVRPRAPSPRVRGTGSAACIPRVGGTPRGHAGGRRLPREASPPESKWDGGQGPAIHRPQRCRGHNGSRASPAPIGWTATGTTTGVCRDQLQGDRAHDQPPQRGQWGAIWWAGGYGR